MLNPRRMKKKSLVALEENILDGIDPVGGGVARGGWGKCFSTFPRMVPARS